MTNAPILFAFGSNGSGQLGIGHNEDVSVPTGCLFEDEERGNKPRDDESGSRGRVARIVAGGNHTLVQLDDGRVYAAGCNEDGRCGVLSGINGDSDPNENVDPDSGSRQSFARFRRVVVNDLESGRVHERFKAVSATWEATVLVGLEGDAVFILGSGAKGELGLGRETVRVVTATRVPDFPPRGTRVVSVASGMGHTVVVLSDGEVYGWGAARKGQLGESVVGEKIIWSPVRIESVPFRVVGATCGREFTILCGDQEAGEFVVLGAIGDKWGILSGVPSAEEVRGYLTISSSWHGVYVHRGDLGVLAWGRDDRGQLPPGNLREVREMAVGSEHVVALLEDRGVVAFGWGEHGNCGPETDAQGNVKGVCSRIPLPEGDFEVVGVGAGCATSWIVAS
ncbi:regulator of chromosome condensation 1/beta-lactamase-inhibitor protein II [Aspergillus egyptiacus]|nr:regulator of chromosome condensation 1/beta-lactamase-inhibitor protein II [Aspergillus egyptiacus]